MLIVDRDFLAFQTIAKETGEKKVCNVLLFLREMLHLMLRATRFMKAAAFPIWRLSLEVSLIVFIAVRIPVYQTTKL